ncbi:MAG: multiprotein bridging factor aMBF1 [Candidatus Thorarchaeota archaeon]
MQDECELCGTTHNLKRYIIEGAEVLACPNCGKFGKPVITSSNRSLNRTAQQSTRNITSMPRQKSFQVRTSTNFSPSKNLRNETYLVEDFGQVIQQARERLGLTRKEVAESLFIRENMLARIEAGKLRPNDDLIKKLEKLLEISLIENSEVASNAQYSNQKPLTNQTRSLTLGDFAHIRKKKNS